MVEKNNINIGMNKKSMPKEKKVKATKQEIAARTETIVTVAKR